MFLSGYVLSVFHAIIKLRASMRYTPTGTITLLDRCCYASVMSARLLATLLTAGRAAFGIGLLFYPRRVARSWLGDEVDRPKTEMLVRAVGARDLVIGAGGVVSLLRGEPAATWLTAGVVADAADFVLTALNFSKLPPSGRVSTMALTGVAAIAGMRLTPKLKPQP